MREKLIELLCEVQYLGGLEEKIANHLIANGITIPVRCKDCAFSEPNDASDNYVDCKQLFGIAVTKDWYCADGERKDNE